MTAEAIQHERSAKASLTKLKLFAIWAAQLAEILEKPDSQYEDIRKQRDSLTRWAPWAIKLPLWEKLHGDLSITQRESARVELVKARDALRSVVSGKHVPVPSTLFGDLSHDIASLHRST
jgi:hypothetical protein